MIIIKKDQLDLSINELKENSVISSLRDLVRISIVCKHACVRINVTFSSTESRLH